MRQERKLGLGKCSIVVTVSSVVYFSFLFETTEEHVHEAESVWKKKSILE
jgi:hypothetical protein